MVNKIILKELLDDKSNFIIYGAGERGREIVRILKTFDIHVSNIVDSNPQKQGLYIEGIEIKPKEWLENTEQDEKIIISIHEGIEVYDDLKTNNYVMPFETADYILRLSYLNCSDYGYESIESIRHFYGPYPEMDVNPMIFPPADINLNLDKQKSILNKIYAYYKNIGFTNNNSTRYNSYNQAFGVVDALVLYTMICETHPRRIVEIGSGFSSAVMLDTNEYVFDNKIQMEFIEPYPNRLKSLLKENDQISLQECNLQDADLSGINELQEGDIVFIDSSHMGKKGSDVNMIYFYILPMIKSGVYIHIHDVFKDFEYPDMWTRKGWVWNEDYIVRAFLMNNKDYEIIFFTDMWTEEFRQNGIGDGGGSLWIKKK